MTLIFFSLWMSPFSSILFKTSWKSLIKVLNGEVPNFSVFPAFKELQLLKIKQENNTEIYPLHITENEVKYNQQTWFNCEFIQLYSDISSLWETFKTLYWSMLYAQNSIHLRAVLSSSTASGHVEYCILEMLLIWVTGKHTGFQILIAKKR